MADRVVSWLPPWADAQRTETLSLTDPHRGPGVHWVCERPREDAWEAVVAQLRAAARVLRAIPIAQLVAVIDKVATRWCDPSWSVRVDTREQVAAATGFSRQAVDHSFDLELRNYRAESLWPTLCRELRNPACLDGFCADSDLPGATRAIGPELTLAVLTGNVPGLPALPIVRSLLVKSAVIAKVASGEPTFASAFARTLAEADARIGDALLVTYWQREETDVLRRAVSSVDAVIAYGGVQACASVRELVTSGQTYVEHGHKLSVGYLSRAFVAKLGPARTARLVAQDTSAFNQQACIAPQAYFIQATPREAADFAEAVANAMREYAEDCPLGELAREDQCSIQYTRLGQQWLAAGSTSDHVFADPKLEWTVALCSGLDFSATQPRFIRIVPVAAHSHAVDMLRPYRHYLQNVGLGALGDELTAAAEAFAVMGASRVSEPGRMAEPSLMWRHDGQLCLAELVRWCDVEMHNDYPFNR
jgi:hypothetical protein